MEKAKFFLAVDPGREKAGMAVLSQEGKVRWMGVVPVRNLERAIRDLNSRFPFREVVLGDSTGMGRTVEILRRLDLEIHLVDERHSSEEARELYFQERFSSFWRRILPISLLFPRHPYDDWQAVVIGRRYLREQRGETLGG